MNNRPVFNGGDSPSLAGGWTHAQVADLINDERQRQGLSILSARKLGNLREAIDYRVAASGVRPEKILELMTARISESVQTGRDMADGNALLSDAAWAITLAHGERAGVDVGEHWEDVSQGARAS